MFKINVNTASVESLPTKSRMKLMKRSLKLVNTLPQFIAWSVQ